MELDETSDLLFQALDGNEVARGRLLERLRPRLVLWLSARMSPALRARIEPEDLAQEVLINVHEGLDKFDASEPKRFRGWVFAIADHRIKDKVDHFGALKRQAKPITPFTQTSPSGAASRSEQVRKLRDAIEGLADDYREVIRLRRLEDRSYEEVAEIMGRSANATRVLYCRALKALGAVLRQGPERDQPAGN